MKKAWLVAAILSGLLAGTAFADGYRGEVVGQGKDDSHHEACHEAEENAYDRLPEDASVTEEGDCECVREMDGDWECQIDVEYVIED